MPKTYNDLSIDFQTLNSDTSSSGTMIKTLINLGVRKVFGLADWTFNKGQKIYSTGTGVSEYFPPYNALKIDYVSYSYGSPGVKYTVQQVMDGEDWERISAVSTTASIPYYWYVSNRNEKVNLYPAASDSLGTVKIGFTKKIKDLGASDYSTGTCGVSTNGTVWTGSGVWTSDMAGRYIQTTNSITPLDGFWFEIDSVASGGTTLYTKELAPNATGSATYKICELIPLPDGFEDLPLWFALGHYHKVRENIPLAREYERLYQEGTSDLMKRDSGFTKNLIEQQHLSSQGNPSFDSWRMGTLS